MILNEEKYAQDLLMGQNDKIKSIRQKIDLISRYNYHVMNKNDDDSYSSIVKWLEKHHEIFSEQTYSKIITDYIKKASKKPFYNVDAIKITKKEMNVILSQNNLRYEKILFVLMCMAKQQKIAYGFDNGLVSYSITDLFKTARVSVPVDERENMLHELLKLNLIGLPVKNDTRCLFVNFLDDNYDEVVLELNEQDCGELAYAYLRFTGKAKISKCAKCGKMIKQSKKYGELCKGCQSCEADMKVRWCVDCGNEFVVNKFDTETNRCENCYKEYRRVYWKEKKREYRSKENMSTAPQNLTTQN